MAMLSLGLYNNREKMKKSNFNYNNQYYNSPARSRYSSRSSRRLQSECGSRDSLNSRNRFYHRIEKACTTFSSNDIKKEVFLYRKEIERLEKQILKKDKNIFELKESNMHSKQLEAELIEVYRVLYMYEGKIAECEKQIKKLEKTIAAKVPDDITQKVEELLQSYRVENSELSGQLEEKTRLIMELEDKLKKTQNKYFNTAWKLSSTKREISNPLKKRFPNLRNTITLNQAPLLEKAKAMNLPNPKNTHFPSQYQITDFDQRPKEPLRFKKMEAPSVPEMRQPTSTPISQSMNRIESADYYSFSNKNNGNSRTYYQIGNGVDQNSRPTQYAAATYASNSIKPVNIQPPSNQNLSSQMTVSNTGTARRIEYREYRQDSPRIEGRGTTGSFKVVEVGRSDGEVRGLVSQSSQGRALYSVSRGIGGGQSIYLK